MLHRVFLALHSESNHACRYGPFWVASTLVFVSAVTGNCASYLAWRKAHGGDDASGSAVWYGDINKVGVG